jgi:hypothetical protein
MQTNRLGILGVLLATAFTTATDHKPALAKSPMTSDQIQVYRAFLSSYTNGSKSPHLNLAKRTSALDLSSEEGKDACLRRIHLDGGAHSESVTHEFDPNTSLEENITLVDTDEQGRVIKENDPSRTMRQDTPVNQAVDRAFSSGLLTLSEVAFDKSHQYAVMKFSFVCGGLCGHRTTVVFEKQNGEWKESKRQCSAWIS